MSRNNLIAEIRRELKKCVDLEYKKGAVNFFTEKITCYGVRTPKVRKIAREHFKQVKRLPKAEVFALAETLFKSGYNEETTIGTQWVRGFEKDFEKSDFETFEGWIGRYFDNWGKIDDFCTHVMSYMLERYPTLIPKVKAWTKSKNRWMRRASVVSFITNSKTFYTKKNLNNIFWVAKILLEDDDDLVQKGYGWMLKVAAEWHQKEVFDFVVRNKKKMPRTALRYAIEKMPKALKQRAMS